MSSNVYTPGDFAATPPAPDAIEALPVSATWKRRFRAIAAGEPSGFNVPALLFGPLYYLAKGMWRQALAMAAINAGAIAAAYGFHWLVSGSTSHLQLGYVYLLSGAAYGIKANKDYYRKVVLGNRRWL